MSRSSTPADLSIVSRPLRLERTQATGRWWMNNDPVGTAVMNALSLSFPDGERFFIKSVRHFEKDAPPHLHDAIRAFVVQEGAHTREHIVFNSLVEAAGFETAEVTKLIDARLEISRARPAVAQLAITVALEHFTASFAHVLLTRPESLSGVPAGVAQLWHWHAIEEIEHKGVAYDLFMHVISGISPLRRWWVRSLAMAITTVHFTTTVRRASLLLLKQDALTGLKARWRLFVWLWLKPGLYRAALRACLAFYRPGFHPWQKDDRGLIDDAGRAWVG